MESEQQHTSPAHAAEQLRQHQQVHDQVEQRGPSQAFAQFGLGIAILGALCLTALLFSAGPGTADRSKFIQVPQVPMLLSLPLLNGAAQRFGIRIRPSPKSWITVMILLLSFLTLSMLSISGVSYPWWLNVLLIAGFFIAIAAKPIRQLWSTRNTSDPERWMTLRLSPPAKRMTILVGVGISLVVAASPHSWFPLVSAGVFLTFLVLMIGWNQPWGLPRTGYEWGPFQWLAFAGALAAVFAVTILLARTDLVTTAATSTAGVVVLGVMVAAALLPLRARES